MSSYKRPPIIEAIIDVQFEGTLSLNEMVKCEKKLKIKYPITKDIQNIEIRIENNGSEIEYVRVVGKRLESHDLEWVVLLYPERLSLIRLAPYTKWEDFFGAFQEVWEIFKKTVGYKSLTRLAVRYLNRIDIPVEDNVTRINIADYLNLGVNMPKGMDADGYDATLGVVIDEHTRAIVRTSTQSPVLPKTVALILDVDLFSETSLYIKTEDIYEHLGLLRIKKNELFEKFVTEKSRTLFNKDIE